jgi:hypothetical protein
MIRPERTLFPLAPKLPLRSLIRETQASQNRMRIAKQELLELVSQTGVWEPAQLRGEKARTVGFGALRKLPIDPADRHGP